MSGETTWRLVPAEATERMIGKIAALMPHGGGYGTQYRHAYSAMLAAAPKPPAGLYVVSADGTARRVEVDEDGLARTLCTSFYEGGTIYEESVETVIEVRWPEWRPQARAVLRALTGEER